LLQETQICQRPTFVLLLQQLLLAHLLFLVLLLLPSLLLLRCSNFLPLLQRQKEV